MDDNPRCASGFRRVHTGSAPGASGAVETSFTCERVQATHSSFDMPPARLKGSAVMTIVAGQATGCSAPNGGQLMPPISCDANNVPQCATGYRRVALGETVFGSRTERTISCERQP